MNWLWFLLIGLAAVWIAGQVGAGRVLYDGTILLDRDGRPAPASGDHEALMLAALRWLTQRQAGEGAK